jgi:hypothetical protein
VAILAAFVCRANRESHYHMRVSVILLVHEEHNINKCGANMKKVRLVLEMDVKTVMVEPKEWCHCLYF